MDIEDITIDEWEELLPDRGFDVFHAPEALSVVEEYSQGTLRLLGGFNGEECVGLFPAVIREQWSFRFVLSPPPGLSIPALGPVLMQASPKRRKQEKLNERFTEGVLKAVDIDDHRTLLGVGTSSAYRDPRPYDWAGLGVTPRFSYVIDLAETNAEALLGSFTSDLRSEIRKRDELDVSIDVEGADAAERVCRDLKRRHVEQGLAYPTPERFSRDLVDALDDRARVYVARTPGGEFLSGITVLYSADKALFWQGGTKADYESVSVNSLLHWKIIQDVLGDPELDSVTRYDLSDATNRRIARYKSKFGPELTPHYEVKSTLMSVAKKAYSARRHVLGRIQSAYSR